MGFKSIILSKQNILQVFFLYHLNSSVNSQGVMDFNMLSPGREEERGVQEATYKNSLSGNEAEAWDGCRSETVPGAQVGVPVWAVISGVIPFLHSCYKATKCPRCEEVKMRSTQ